MSPLQALSPSVVPLYYSSTSLDAGSSSRNESFGGCGPPPPPSGDPVDDNLDNTRSQANVRRTCSAPSVYSTKTDGHGITKQKEETTALSLDDGGTRIKYISSYSNEISSQDKIIESECKIQHQHAVGKVSITTTAKPLTATADVDFASSSVLNQSTTLIRLEPEQSAGVAAASAPWPVNASTPTNPVDAASAILQTNTSRTNSPKPRPPSRDIAAENRHLSSGTKKKKENLDEKRRQKAEVRILQARQCDFPESMSPMNGRSDLEADMAQGTGNRDFRSTAQDNLTQSSHRIGMRSGMRQGDNEEDDPNAAMAPTPMFERLFTDEVQENKSYRRILDTKNRRLAELEKIQGDLEGRLQSESRGRRQLEATLEAREREWSRQLEYLENDRNHWRTLVSTEEKKNAKLMDEVMRKEQEIRRMVQRKYDNGGRGSQGVTTRGPAQHEKGKSRSPEMNRSELMMSPRQVLEASGSVEEVRQRNVEGLLGDFFGI